MQKKQSGSCMLGGMRYSPSLAAILLMTSILHAGSEPSPSAEDRGEVLDAGAWLKVRLPWDAATEKQVNDLLAGCEAAFEKLDPAAASYEGTFLAWDLLDADLDTIGSFASWDFYNSPDAAVREKGEKTEELMGKLGARLYNLKAPYSVLKRSFDKLSAGLTEERRSFAQEVLRDFEKNGVHLEGAELERLKQIDEEKVELSTKFGKVLKEREILLPVTAEQVKTLTPESLKKDEKSGETLLILREDSYLDVMRRHPDRALRELCYRRFHEETLDLVPVIDRIRKLRRERSQLVAKTDYVTLELQDEGFTPEQVRSTLEELKGRTAARYEETLLDYTKLNGGTPPKSWDLAYLEETAPSEGVNPDVFLEYFTPERAVETLFSLSGKLYGLTFKAQPPHPEHRIDSYKVFDADGKELGDLILDLFPRSNKFSHAACWTKRGRATHHPTRTAAVGLSMNLKEKPLEGGGKGLLLDEVQTLFHEFGHVLHAFLIESEPLGAHDSPASLVEVPSQVFESWALDPAVLTDLARHYKTKEPLTPGLLQALYRKSQRFAARHVRTQILYSLFDLDFHANPDTEPQVIWDGLTAALFGPGLYPKGVPWFSRFGHLDGYGAKYWGYKFADLGKAQIYWFLVRTYPDLTSREVGKYLRERFLSFGGLKKLPQAASDVTGTPLTALPYVLETLLDYPTMRQRLTGAKGDYPQALEAVFGSMTGGK